MAKTPAKAFDAHAELAKANVTTAHLSDVQAFVASGKISFGDVIGLIIKYGPAVLAVLSTVWGVVSGGGTFDLPTLLGLVKQLSSIPVAHDAIVAILGLLHIPVPAGF